jgi:hypothetical protein
MTFIALIPSLFLKNNDTKIIAQPVRFRKSFAGFCARNKEFALQKTEKTNGIKNFLDRTGWVVL